MSDYSDVDDLIRKEEKRRDRMAVIAGSMSKEAYEEKWGEPFSGKKSPARKAAKKVKNWIRQSIRGG